MNFNSMERLSLLSSMGSYGKGLVFVVSELSSGDGYNMKRQ